MTNHGAPECPTNTAAPNATAQPHAATTEKTQSTTKTNTALPPTVTCAPTQVTPSTASTQAAGENSAYPRMPNGPPSSLSPSSFSKNATSDPQGESYLNKRITLTIHCSDGTTKTYSRPGPHIDHSTDAELLASAERAALAEAPDGATITHSRLTR